MAVISENSNQYLGASWPAPAWNDDQVATVSMVLSLAQQDVNYSEYLIPKIRALDRTIMVTLSDTDTCRKAG